MAQKENDYWKSYYQKNKDKVLERSRNYYKNNRDHVIKKTAEYALKHQVRLNGIKRGYRKKMISGIFDALGNKCNKCGIEDKRILQIDHIFGDGADHRRKVGLSFTTYNKSIETSIKNKEERYRLLCCNCNWIEAIEKGVRTSIWS